MAAPQFVVGVDLGTTHCAMAAAWLERPRLQQLAIPQLVAPGEVGRAELLPSFLYLPAPGEFRADELELPWGSAQTIVGRYARTHGAKNPARLVASAKSWVCHGGVNRRAAILPWSAPDDQPHVSPYQAQVSYLAHLERCWNEKHPDAPLSEQEVVVTVPASFDEGARTLTSEAAAEAGLGRVRLLEEPQAAFYDYLGALSEQPKHGARTKYIEEQLASARLILVVDVGGGTTDLTLLRVLPGGNTDGTELATIERIAVGGHLMLGGDNMDAALAFYALNKAGMARPEDATIWSSLVQSARDAKERLLSADAPAEATISYQGRGSRLIGTTKSLSVTRQEAIEVLLDGCFPQTGPTDVAERSARAGLTTLGLPYTSDTAVTRHICAFLRRHVVAASDAGAVVHDGLPRPDLLLLNGGVFQAPSVVARLQDVLASWYDGQSPVLLEHTSLTTSVARGAVRFSLAQHGLGTLIRGGTAKAYYIGIEHESRTRALCVAPRNLEEGTRAAVRDRSFQLRLNEPVVFPLFASTGDRADGPGTLLDLATHGDELDPLSPIETLLRGRKDSQVRESTVSVSIESLVDELGNLQLSLVSAELPPRRWKLEFVVRDHARSPSEERASDAAHAATTAASQDDASSRDDASPPHPDAPQARRRIISTFEQPDTEAVAGLRRALEELLGPRGQWSSSTCRMLADACLSVEAHRTQSDAHELNWLRLLSWTLRPGCGAGGDEQRVDAVWALEPAGPAVATKTNWGEWWILWRRVAPGLSASRQQALFERVRPSLWPKGKPPPGPPPQGPVEMMRMVAAFERLPAEAKAEAGALFLERIKKLGSYWPLGRVGARVPFHGSEAAVVPKELARRWLERLFTLDWKREDGAAFAAASLARMSGNPDRDLDESLRKQVAERLTEVGAKDSWIDMVLYPTSKQDEKSVLGESLPVGLRLG